MNMHEPMLSNEYCALYDLELDQWLCPNKGYSTEIMITNLSEEDIQRDIGKILRILGLHSDRLHDFIIVPCEVLVDMEVGPQRSDSPLVDTKFVLKYHPLFNQSIPYVEWLETASTCYYV